MKSTLTPISRLTRDRELRSGMALLVVLVLIMLLSLSAFGFTLSMQNQYRLSRVQEDQVQAKFAALSGVELVAAILSQSVEARSELGDLADNRDLFQDVAFEPNDSTAAEKISGWNFSIVSFQSKDEASRLGNNDAGANGFEAATNFTFGLQNESAKVHLPTLAEWDRDQPGHARRVLESLPGATRQLVDLVLKRMSSQEPSTVSTAELQSLWFGDDLNCNYQLDPVEVTCRSWKSNQGPNANKDGEIATIARTSQTGSPVQDLPDRHSDNLSSVHILGWQQYLTWVSGERNETLNGRAKVYLNSNDLQELHRSLREKWPEELANFVVALRQFGPSFRTLSPVVSRSRNAKGPDTKILGTNSASSQAESELEGYQPDFSIAASYAIRTPLELIGATVQIPKTAGSSSGNSGKRQLISPLRDEIGSAGDYLGRLLNDVTTDSRSSRPGRIDVNQAPFWVLMAVPGMDKELAERIVTHRHSRRRRAGKNSPDNSELESQHTIAWLFEHGLVDLQKLSQLEPYLTARSDVYSFQVVGYKDEEHAVYRATVTVDARGPEPIMRNFRTWHDWDRGFEIDQLKAISPE